MAKAKDNEKPKTPKVSASVAANRKRRAEARAARK